MREEELTSEEVAKILATEQRAKNVQNQIQQSKQELMKAQDQQAKILKKVKKRLQLPEELSVEDMEFSDVDFDSFQGKIVIPEEEED